MRFMLVVLSLTVLAGCMGGEGQYEYDFRGTVFNLDGEGTRTESAFIRPNLALLMPEKGVAIGAYEGFDGPSLILILRSVDLREGEHVAAIDGDVNEAWLLKGHLECTTTTLQREWQLFVSLSRREREEIKRAYPMSGSAELTVDDEGNLATLHVSLMSEIPIPAPAASTAEEHPASIHGTFIRYWNSGKAPWWWI